MSLPPAICQVAFCALDAKRLRAWYQDAFGFLPSGGTIFAGPLAKRVQGLERALTSCRWLVDSQDVFQLEFFGFVSPKSRRRRSDSRLSDLGYQMIGIHVADFDATLARLRQLGSAPRMVGDVGARIACVRDPEGNWVEILEQDPLGSLAPVKARPEVNATLRSVTLSVANLEAARSIWVDGFGLPLAPCEALHGPEHEVTWGLDDARRKSLLVQAGGVLLELVEYEVPKPRSHPPGYQISDQGYMNIALGFTNRDEFDRFFDRAVNIGCRPNGKPLDISVFRVMYVNEPVGGESIELLLPRRWAFGISGFRPSRHLRRREPVPRWQSAWITGAGSGIGLQIAEDLAKEGANLVLLDARFLPETRDRLRAARKHEPQTLEMLTVDVADSEAVERAVGAAAVRRPAPDLVIHSAGIQLAKPFSELTADEYRRVIEVNLIGSRNVAAAVLPRLQTGARFAFVASLAGLLPSYSYAAYSSSKYGIVGLAGTLRLEYKPQGIAISVICPPEVDTPMVTEERRTMHPATKALKELAGTLDVETAAREILDGLARGEFLVIPGGRAKLTQALDRFVPRSMSHRIADLVVSSALRDAEHD
jgi:NAD(P)-dependent dehydrogenase (short-subunit alcohol dehydrogenase family)/catechol 2,3-dioxygenase-like lactoylglutathione lyase family enzyme